MANLIVVLIISMILFLALKPLIKNKKEGKCGCCSYKNSCNKDKCN